MNVYRISITPAPVMQDLDADVPLHLQEKDIAQPKVSQASAQTTRGSVKLTRDRRRMLSLLWRLNETVCVPKWHLSPPQPAPTPRLAQGLLRHLQIQCHLFPPQWFLHLLGEDEKGIPGKSISMKFRYWKKLDKGVSASCTKAPGEVGILFSQ